MELGRFRRSIPFLFSIGLLIFWWAILPLIGPVDGVFDASRPVNYWSLITPNRNGPVLALWLIFILIAVVVAFSAFRLYRGCLFAVSWILITLAVASSLLVMFLYLFIHADTELQHVQTVDYQGHQYHLADSHHPHEWDYVVSTYIVFECDHTGNTCRELTSLPSDTNPQKASLTTSQTALFLEQGQSQIQIKP